ncbi:hypothetical protein RND81_12G071000 [Saponaria officinalis]|uniref:Uncharacterized protein n=1 Tax=Saponaria officinalis TaxID=3572 RepID=A0AAW1H7K5_SAPOF
MLPNTTAFANRVVAYLKKNKFHEAENDCTEALKLNADYFKVYWRRATARKEVGLLTRALEDAEYGLKLEPDNEEVNKLCAELKTMLDKTSRAGCEYGEEGAACDVDSEGK